MGAFDRDVPIIGGVRVISAWLTIIAVCECSAKTVMVFRNKNEGVTCPGCGHTYALLDEPSGRIGRIAALSAVQ